MVLAKLANYGIPQPAFQIQDAKEETLDEVAHENEPRLAVPSCHGRRWPG